MISSRIRCNYVLLLAYRCSVNHNFVTICNLLNWGNPQKNPKTSSAPPLLFLSFPCFSCSLLWSAAAEATTRQRQQRAAGHMHLQQSSGTGVCRQIDGGTSARHAVAATRRLWARTTSARVLGDGN